MEFKAFLVITGIVVYSFESSVFGMENNVIISKGYVSKLCSDRCHQSTETALVEDCERGCRFFEYAETADLVDFNETAFHLLCVSNCNEAYVVEKNRDVCISGCNFAKKEIDNIMEMSHHVLEEAEKQMNFLNSIIGMVSSTFWSTEDAENDVPKDVQQRTLVSGQLLDLLGDMPTQGNKLDDKLSAGDVEIINLMGDEMSSVDPAEISLCATRLWLHRLSFILIVMGSISLLFISIFYILAFMKHKKSKENPEATENGDSTNLDPPSYETLIKSGYIVVADNYLAPLHDEKKEKIFLA